jgi:hypothetical protein
MFRSVITIRTGLLGLASWIIPFVAAFAFFDSSGQLQIAQPLFKSLMVVIAGGAGAYLLVVAFRKLPATLMSGLGLGLFWMALNLGLDIAVLLPMSGQPISAWFQDIGLRYLLIPVMAMAIGAAADGKS